MVRSSLSRSHSGIREIAGLTLLYALYEVIRGAGGENARLAMRHTDDIVAVEQFLGVYVERSVQGAFEALPYVPAFLGLLYLLLHFAGTAVALTWIHRAHPDRFPLVRTTFVAATALALIGYVSFPAAPPRLAELGFSDTVTRSTGLDLSSDLLGALYNPFAAVPSLHFGYALIVGVALATIAERRVIRVAGALYPVAMLLVIVGTGNHFFVDAALGGVAVVLGWLVAQIVVRPAAGVVDAVVVAPEAQGPAPTPAWSRSRARPAFAGRSRSSAAGSRARPGAPAAGGFGRAAAHGRAIPVYAASARSARSQCVTESPGSPRSHMR
jgi:PAP2 superfamily